MIEPPQDDPRMQEALRQLEFRMALFRGLDFTRARVESMIEVVREHRRRWRLKGLDFPELVPIVVPRLGIFDLKRADLDPQSVAVSLLNFVRDTPQATMHEVVGAFSDAYGCTIHVDDMRAGIERARADMARREGRHRAIDELAARGELH